jgi:hypothetical protein
MLGLLFIFGVVVFFILLFCLLSGKLVLFKKCNNCGSRFTYKIYYEVPAPGCETEAFGNTHNKTSYLTCLKCNFKRK